MVFYINKSRKITLDDIFAD